MIFVSVGTEKFPFNRLLKAVDEAAAKELKGVRVFAQTGTSNYKTYNIERKEYLAFDEMVRYVNESDIIVTHAGIGSTISTLSLGKIPILVPRQAEKGEHVDNHQMDFAKKIESIGKAIVAYDDKGLIEKIVNYHALASQIKPTPESLDKKNLINYLKSLC